MLSVTMRSLETNLWKTQPESHFQIKSAKKEKFITGKIEKLDF